jgi:UDP-3-O-[3-hydroxymyristoyl] glucosamine N-acyltransferase
MAEFGEISPEQCMAEMPDGFIDRDEASGRVFYVPDHILVHDKNGDRVEGSFRLDPETGTAIEESAYVIPAARLGNRVIVYAKAKILNARIEDDVILEDKVMVHSGVTVSRGGVVGRRSTHHDNVFVGPDANVGSRCEVTRGAHIETGVTVLQRQSIPVNSIVTHDTPQRSTKHRGNRGGSRRI